MNFGNEIQINFADMIDFIYRSKRKCFAATDIKTNLSNGTSVYSNRELPWLYNDIYCGNTVERGTEDVYYDMILVWSLQYRGGVIEEFHESSTYHQTTDVVSTFLKHALMDVPSDFPVRGPKSFGLDTINVYGQMYKGPFKYKNQWNGDIKRFFGHEEITWSDRIVYYHDYIGGLIRNKYFPVIIS